MLLIAGIALLALGLCSGAVLLASPFGLLPATPGTALWLMFPAFIVVGYILFVVPANSRQIRLMSRLTSALLVALAVGAALGLFLISATLVTSFSGTSALWYVLAIGTLLGATGLMSSKAPE